MSNITGTIRGRATLEAATTNRIYLVPVPTANTEVSQDLSDNTKSFTIRVQGRGELKWATEPASATLATLPPGVTYGADGLNFTGTLYFQTTTPSQIVEIIEWS